MSSTILQEIYLGNNLEAYIRSIGIFWITFLCLKLFFGWIKKQANKLSLSYESKFPNLITKIVEGIGLPFYLFFSLFVAIQNLVIPNFWLRALYGLAILTFTFYIVRTIQHLIIFGIQNWISKNRDEDEDKASFDPSIVNLIGIFTNIFLWLVATIFVLQNFDINVGALIGGLGISGIAIAFALQNILSDIFASFTIYFDKPFRTGDFITLTKGDSGTVEKIGIKSTRIRTLEGQTLIVSNKELTEIRINNYREMVKRRVLFNFGVEYSTNSQKLKLIPKLIEDIISKLEICSFDRANFLTFGDSALSFEVVYHINDNSYKTYVETQEKINLDIIETFDKEGIQMAFPSQTVYIKNL